jgi:hypothetical protein
VLEVEVGVVAVVGGEEVMPAADTGVIVGEGDGELP